MQVAADAAREGNITHFHGLPEDELQRLVKKTDEDGRSLLHTAAGAGHLNIVQFLLDNGAQGMVNKQDEEVYIQHLSLILHRTRVPAFLSI